MSGVMQLLLGGSQVIPDPYFEYTTLLLPGNGTNGAQNNTFLDASTNNFTITRNGNTTQGTFSPFSQTGWGNYFDGTGDYLSVSGGVTNAGTGDFTLEFWAYYTGNYANYETAFDSRTSAGSFTNGFNVGLDITTGYWYAGFAVQDLLTTIPAAKNQWTHIAVTRSGTTMRLFVNGTVAGSITTSNNLTSTTNFIGTYYNANNYYFNGYISNLRAVKGTAVYTSNFTPPTVPLTAITNTSLLTCQSNRFIDNSTNNFTITRNGDVSVQAFSPFNPTAAWSAATNGGSGYFDGSGDYLTTTTSSALDLSTGDWTIQGWYYPTAYAAGNNVLAYVGASAGDKIVIATIGTGGALYYLLNGGVVITGGSAPLNAWAFFALVKSGSTTTLYLNGVSQGTTTSVPTSSNKSLNLGSDAGAAPYQGYMADFRILKGTANTAVPTAPLTAITNTSLLLNFTNAGIYDATSKNDLETVGNAQISTTQSKFGGSSVYFDGTGDYLLPSGAASNNLLALGSGDFTIEFWVRYAALGDVTLMDWRPASTNGAYPTLFNDVGTNKLIYYTNSATRITSSTVFATNTWYHVAIARYSGSTKMYINGVNEGSAYSDTNNYLSAALRPVIGANGFSTGSVAVNAYFQDIRITKGIARYTSNFTPPTTAFPLL